MTDNLKEADGFAISRHTCPIADGLWRLIIISILLIAINIITVVVVEQNQAADIYPGYADSIGIPIAGTQILSLVLCPFLSLILCIPKITKKIYSLHSGMGGRIGSICVIGICYTPCLFLFLRGSLYWTSPNHMSIAFWFYLALVYLLFLAFKDLSIIEKKKSFGCLKRNVH